MLTRKQIGHSSISSPVVHSATPLNIGDNFLSHTSFFTNLSGQLHVGYKPVGTECFDSNESLLKEREKQVSLKFLLLVCPIATKFLKNKYEV